MSQHCTTTCDACGTAANSRSGNFAWERPRGWLTVISAGPVITGDMPHQHAQKQPDLCSWRCVAAYAATYTQMEDL